MVHIPEPFVVFPTRFFDGGEHHSHECYQHDIACCTRSSAKVDDEPAFEPEIFGHGETGKVYPVGNSVDPREEDDGPGDEFVEGDVLVKVDDAVERGTTEE